MKEKLRATGCPAEEMYIMPRNSTLTTKQRAANRLNLPSRSPKDQPVGAAAENPPSDGIIFADENARIAWEVSEALKLILTQTPPEGSNLVAHAISFSPEDRTRGIYALLFSGTLASTRRRGVYVVPERSMRILSELGVSYRVEQ